MSRNQIVLLVALVAAIGGGVAWYVLRGKGGDLNIAPNKNLPPLPEAKIAPGDWPWWRGPARNGHSPDPAGPLKWSETENVVWKTPIPGKGHSSPVLIGNRVFLTTADEASQKQIALSLDRGTGKILWRTTIHEGNFGHKHSDNTFASGTPCSDGP